MNIIKSKVGFVLEWISIVIFSGMTLLASWQVFTRYILNNPSTTSEITAKYMFVWLVFIGAAYVFGKREHMNIGFIKDKMSPKVQFILNIIIEVLIVLLLVTYVPALSMWLPGLLGLV
ncbi:MAG: TRAP transporter small permease subunit [Coprobacillaceae bacterium]